MHRSAIAAATTVVDRLAPADLVRPTPCDGWSVADLLAHMIGQNRGFAAAVRDGDAPEIAYVPVPFARELWASSAGELTSAFASRALDDEIREVELHPHHRLPLSALVAAQLLDTVVHTWDLAQSLGVSFVPPADQAAAVLAVAEGVPASARTGPAAPFGPARHTSGDDWHRALSLLGRDPDAHPAAREHG